MTKPTAADDVDLYLAALNEELALGLRSRARVLVEACAHLREAAMAELEALAVSDTAPGAAGVTGGELAAVQADRWAEAQRRAIAAFGSPREVARGFESGLVGRLDRALMCLDGRLQALRRQPFAWVISWPLACVALGLVLAATGAIFTYDTLNAEHPFQPQGTNAVVVMALAGGLIFCLMLGYVLIKRPRGLSELRGLPARPRRAPYVWREWVPFYLFLAYVSMVMPQQTIRLMGVWLALALVVELIARLGTRVPRRAAPRASGARPYADANWAGYLRATAAATAITLAVVVGQSNPTVGLGGAFCAVLLGVMAVTVLVRRLAWNSSVRRSWGKMYERAAGNDPPNLAPAHQTTPR